MSFDGSTSLYKLERISDNPQYEGFAFVRDQSLLGDGRLASDFQAKDLDSTGRVWRVHRLAPFWSPQPVTGRVRAFNDFPCVNFLIPAFSRRAVDALREFLEPNGELLSLVSSIGEYYAYNVTTVADILDREKSQIDWLDDSDRGVQNIFDIDRYECVRAKMVGLSVFRLVEMPSSVYVTQVFVDRVAKHGLKGFHFIKLWPLPNGLHWSEGDRKQWKSGQEVKTDNDALPIRGNTVVVCIPLAKKKASKAEKERFSKLMDEIDVLLYEPTAGDDTRYFGSLEGSDHVDGEFRLFITCPNADALVEELRPWLQRLSQERTVKVMKRYGEYVDPSCREEWVTI